MLLVSWPCLPISEEVMANCSLSSVSGENYMDCIKLQYILSPLSNNFLCVYQVTSCPRLRERRELLRSRFQILACCPTVHTGPRPSWKSSWTLNLTTERGHRLLLSMWLYLISTRTPWLHNYCFRFYLTCFLNFQWDQWDHKCKERRCHFNTSIPQPHQLLQGERLSSTHSALNDTFTYARHMLVFGGTHEQELSHIWTDIYSFYGKF